MNIIGLSGKAGSGKDYVGKVVFEALGFKKWALAWPMKNESFGENRNWTWDLVHRDKPENVRSWLQKRGTEEGWMRYDQDYWLRIARGWMETIEKEWGISDFYIPDVRFPHEVTFIQSVLGGKVVRLTGRQSSSLSPEQAAHLSETALDEWLAFDAFIDNAPGTDVGNLRMQFAQLSFMRPYIDATNHVLVPPILGDTGWYNDAMRNIAPR